MTGSSPVGGSNSLLFSVVYNKSMILTRPFPNTEILVIKEFASEEENSIIYEYLYSMYLAQKEKDDSLKRLDLADKSFETINKLEKIYRVCKRKPIPCCRAQLYHLKKLCILGSWKRDDSSL